MPLTIWQAAQRRFDVSRPERIWATPGEMATRLDPLTRQTPALELIDEHLVALADGDIDRLLVTMPPQEGKSERVSRRFPTWKLQHDPNTRFAIVSFEDERARRWGRRIKGDLEQHPELGLRLRRDSHAAGRWQIAGYRGGVYCVGVGGALTGEPVDIMVIDDPIKDLEHALSPVYRERAKRFWQSVAVPRLGPTSKVVLIQTRWHALDLAGYLLDNDPDRWSVVNIPAVAEDDDPLDRAPGQGMVSARGERDWAAIKAEVGEYVWAALYQQRPAPSEGGLFKRAKIRHWSPLTEDVMRGPRVDLAGRELVLGESWRFLTVDLAASTKSSADYTVAGCWAVGPGGDLVLLDGIRIRADPSQHWPPIRALRERWAADTIFVESRMFGTTLVYEAGREGVPLSELHADTDKWTRALPAAARADTGRLWLPSLAECPWVAEWVDELAAFPNAAHDDVTDVVAYAARVAAAHWLPPGIPAEYDRRSRPDRDAIDLLNAPM